METLLPLFVQVVSGAIGAVVAGIIFSNYTLGPLGNILAGIVGGGLGGLVSSQVTRIIGAEGVGEIVADILSGGAGGICLMLLAGFTRRKTTR
jgi:hypothetical protein